MHSKKMNIFPQKKCLFAYRSLQQVNYKWNVNPYIYLWSNVNKRRLLMMYKKAIEKEN